MASPCLDGRYQLHALGPSQYKQASRPFTIQADQRALHVQADKLGLLALTRCNACACIPLRADQCAVEAKLEVLRKEQKRLVALLADKVSTCDCGCVRDFS